MARRTPIPDRLRLRTALTLACTLAGCTGPDVAESALFVLDDEARAAGVAIEISGEAQPADGPIAAPSSAEVAVRRGTEREPIDAHPGEVIAIEGREGRVRRGVDAARLVVDADREQALRFAELGGMQAIPLADGRFLIDGENAMWTALLFPEVAGRVSPWSPSRLDVSNAGWLSPNDATWAARTTVGIDETDVQPDFVPSSDLAAYVGAYVADDLVLVLDAQGGMHVTGRGVERHGTFGLDDRAQLVFRFENGTMSPMRTTGEDELRDPNGLRFHTMPVVTPALAPRDPSVPEPLGNLLEGL
ncbi:MAG: hypothetical protein J0L92_19845 [Deltaproteobacteria bacterium]|nr:hypothetical protein [Deltaproteobacteria bacterium]